MDDHITSIFLVPFCRTCDEFDAGHPPAAINIPYFHILNGEGKHHKSSLQINFVV